MTGATLTTTNGKGDTGKGDPGQGDLSKHSTWASVAAQQEAAPNHVQVEHESFENFVRGQFSSLATKMDSILAGQATLEKRCEAIESRVDSNTQQSSDIIRSLNFESERINEHEAELADLKQVVKELRIKSQQDTSIINSLTSDMNGLQRYTRSFNVRILGMPEEKDENCVESVERLFVEHFDVPNGSIEHAHRVGKSDARKPRQMIARFHSRATRRVVMVPAMERLLPIPGSASSTTFHKKTWKLNDGSCRSWRNCTQKIKIPALQMVACSPMVNLSLRQQLMHSWPKHNSGIIFPLFVVIQHC